MEGLTHPFGGRNAYGLNAHQHHFRLVPGDKYLAVLSDSKSKALVDAIPFGVGSDLDDPRPYIARLALDWARRHGLLGRLVKPTPHDAMSRRTLSGR